MLKHDFEGSSNVVSAMYHPLNQKLIVVFTKAGAYEYSGVPIKIWTDFIDTDSPGKFVHANLRDRYPTTKVEL